MKVEQAEYGIMCVVTETEDGRIAQVGLTEEQSKMLQIFLSSLSKEKPLALLPKQYDLVRNAS